MEYKYSYRFSRKAEQDLDELLHYISIELANPFAAQKLGRKIFDKIELIRSFPDTGTLIDNEFVFDRTTR